MAYERSESALDNFGTFIHQFQPETKTLIRKLERILIKLHRQNVSLLLNRTHLNERLQPNYTHTHTHTHIYIYISYTYLTIYIYIYIYTHICNNMYIYNLYTYVTIYIYVEKGKISYFGLARKFNSTLNFTQSGWLILFTPDLHFRPPNRVSCQTHSHWLENADQCRRSIGRSSIAMLFSWSTPPSADILLRL